MYLGFVVLVLLLLALDLGVLNRKAHVIGVKEALGWSAFWIALGVAFSGVIYLGYDAHWLGLGLTQDAMSTPYTLADGTIVYNDGRGAWLKYLTGYVVEKALAVDNIFVIAMIFGSFAVPPIYQHRVLFWGIIGALLMRGGMIAVGAVLIREVAWILYVFGGFLVLTGLKMLFVKGESSGIEDNAVVRFAKRFWPVSERYHGEHFFVRAGSAASLEPATPDGRVEHDAAVAAARPGAWLMTPLFLALVLVEATDLIFAVDSIPAIFAITTDPFLVFTSNVFAVLGLRSLYFALAGMMEKFRYLKVALSFVLILVGTKMLAHGPLKAWLGDHFNLVMLGAIVVILALGVVASLWADRSRRDDGVAPGSAA